MTSFPLAFSRSSCVARRVDGEVPAVLRAGILSVAAHEGTADDAAHRIVPRHDLPGDLADLILPLQRDHILVHGDLHEAVRRKIDDGISGAHMLIAQHLDDLRAGGGIVSDDLGADPGLQLADDPVREMLSEHPEGFFHHETGNLEMPIGGVFCVGLFRTFAVAARGVGGRPGPARRCCKGPVPPCAGCRAAPYAP